jgi:hypothetical protein
MLLAISFPRSNFDFEDSDIFHDRITETIHTDLHLYPFTCRLGTLVALIALVPLVTLVSLITLEALVALTSTP